jgi:hypothetical protein
MMAITLERYESLNDNYSLLQLLIFLETFSFERHYFIFFNRSPASAEKIADYTIWLPIIEECWCNLEVYKHVISQVLLSVWALPSRIEASHRTYWLVILIWTRKPLIVEFIFMGYLRIHPAVQISLVSGRSYLPENCPARRIKRMTNAFVSQTLHSICDSLLRSVNLIRLLSWISKVVYTSHGKSLRCSEF